MLRAIWYPVRHAAVLMMAFVVLFVGWGWEPLAEILKRFEGSRIVVVLERRVVKLSSYSALAWFVVLWFLFAPVQIAALWLTVHGYVFLGPVLVMTVKFLGTAIVARFFTLARPALTRLSWFAPFYERWMLWQNGLLGIIYASYLWRKAREVKELVRYAARGLKNRINKWRMR